MPQMSEFLGSSSVLKVQVKSQGQRFFLEHVHQGLRGCDGHCFCHLMSSTQNIFVVLQFSLTNKSLSVEGYT